MGFESAPAEAAARDVNLLDFTFLMLGLKTSLQADPSKNFDAPIPLEYGSHVYIMR